MSYNPTEEQIKVINHVNGHARVLAVAGSGKTTTMVYRIKNLIEKHNINPKSIRVLMFNRSASEDFKSKASENIKGVLPYISTFHAFAFQFIQMARKEGRIHEFVLWENEFEFEKDILLHKVIEDLAKKSIIDLSKVDVDEARASISLWKASLIRPENAGHKFYPGYIDIYKEFEDRRNKANALTFDDFIPITIETLESNGDYMSKWSNKLEHLIVDEYQDVNYGQQRLIEILAGARANIMVVGDDDQTIYEWRGARPKYILKEFTTTFTSKPHTTFKLTRTFRFGPMLAQYAHNCISMNSVRQEKNVLAQRVDQITDIEIIRSDNTKEIKDTNTQLVKIIKKLVLEKEVKKKDIQKKIRVIGRLYSQFANLEMACIKSKVPYKIEGSIPFYKRREIKILLNYGVVIENLYTVPNEKLIKLILDILNTPNRKINKTRFENYIELNKDLPIIDIIEGYSKENSEIDDFRKFLNKGNAFLKGILDETNNLIESCSSSDFINWIYKESDLQKFYLNFYGEGEAAANKINTTISFIELCGHLRLSPSGLWAYIKNLDSTRGAAPDELIYFSTVHKTKGLEFDYVFIPDCQDGNMPYLTTNQLSVFDTRSPELSNDLSDALENERRLFYVAVTRAIKKAFIGTSLNDYSKPSRFLEEIQFEKTRKALYPIVHKKIEIDNWINHIKTILGNKKIINNLRVYLGLSNNIELRRQIDDLSVNVPEEEFRYDLAYSSKPSYLDEESDSNEPSPWDDVEVF